jgi:hypothetical protein
VDRVTESVKDNLKSPQLIPAGVLRSALNSVKEAS